jgi:transcriptional regulator with GAF, ATPase, and Fis domain
MRLVSQKHFEVELPEEILAGFGWQEVEVPRRIREALVMELLRLDRLSEAEAARFLELNRQELLQTMGRYQVPAIQMSPEEFRQELAGEIQRDDPS